MSENTIKNALEEIMKEMKKLNRYELDVTAHFHPENGFNVSLSGVPLKGKEKEDVPDQVKQEESCKSIEEKINRKKALEEDAKALIGIWILQDKIFKEYGDSLSQRIMPLKDALNLRGYANTDNVTYHQLFNNLVINRDLFIEDEIKKLNSEFGNDSIAPISMNLDSNLVGPGTTSIYKLNFIAIRRHLNIFSINFITDNKDSVSNILIKVEISIECSPYQNYNLLIGNININDKINLGFLFSLIQPHIGPAIIYNLRKYLNILKEVIIRNETIKNKSTE